MSEGTTAANLNSREKPTRAAQYVRMSTEKQEYSIANQQAAIHEYARRRNYEIVRTYADHGKSGLSFDGRGALRQLIEDVQSGSALFGALLVYDVSRWGRFQDADESAYYEYVCRRAGIAVLYCAEQFENDGSPLSAIVKGIKRAMAAEYSRELSQKVFAGQARVVELGFRGGGQAIFGLQRQVLRQDGTIRGPLNRGERKSFPTDRIVLVPGPAEEADAVRWMFQAFADGLREVEIAARLNALGISTSRNGRWNAVNVKRTLKNEQYVGTSIWNQSTQRLRTKRVRNLRESWLRRENAFQPLVDRATFDRVQAIYVRRKERFSDERLLEDLRALASTHPTVRYELVNATSGMPSGSTYQKRFGSLSKALLLVGSTPIRTLSSFDLRRQLKRVREMIFADIERLVGQAGGDTKRVRSVITINGEFTLSVSILRCEKSLRTKWLTWLPGLSGSRKVDIAVSARMNATNDAVLDYLIVPKEELDDTPRRLALSRYAALSAFRFPTLEPLMAICASRRL